MDYTTTAQRASDMLDRYGGPATLFLVEDGEYNPTTGTVSQIITDIECTAVRTAYSIKEIDGKKILQGDFKLIASGSALGEGECDIAAQFGGSKFRVINVKPVSPDGLTTMLYFLQCRK
ncbi:hypothetical protein ACLEX4_15690 [Pseudescherichia vulneris]